MQSLEVNLNRPLTNDELAGAMKAWWLRLLARREQGATARVRY